MHVAGVWIYIYTRQKSLNYAYFFHYEGQTLPQFKTAFSFQHQSYWKANNYILLVYYNITTIDYNCMLSKTLQLMFLFTYLTDGAQCHKLYSWLREVRNFSGCDAASLTLQLRWHAQPATQHSTLSVPSTAARHAQTTEQLSL